MPITSRCNSRCVTCNVWKTRGINDIDHNALSNALSDPFFAKVTTVGINGGEFTLVPDFPEVIKALFTLPSLNNLYLISNGLTPTRLFEYLQQAKQLCLEKGIKIHFCLSVDGVGKIHETVRGIPSSFERTKQILNKLSNEHSVYCDSWSIGCTISKYNIGNIRETEAFLNSFNVPIEYHLAVPNKRIGTFEDAEYSVLSDEESRYLAAEFFYCKYLDCGDTPDGNRYFATYYYLKNKGQGRLCSCSYLNRDVTIDEGLGLSLCATASDIIGSLKMKTASEYLDSGELDTMKNLVHCNCDTCIHYAYHPLTYKGRKVYLKEHLNRSFILSEYHIKAQSPSISKYYRLLRLNLSKKKAYIRGLLTYNYNR